MYRVELFVNYALRELLPLDLLNAMNGRIQGSDKNTILTTFSESSERNAFISLCRKYGFQTRIL